MTPFVGPFRKEWSGGPMGLLGNSVPGRRTHGDSGPQGSPLPPKELCVPRGVRYPPRNSGPPGGSVRPLGTPNPRDTGRVGTMCVRAARRLQWSRSWGGRGGDSPSTRGGRTQGRARPVGRGNGSGSFRQVKMRRDSPMGPKSFLPFYRRKVRVGDCGLLQSSTGL